MSTPDLIELWRVFPWDASAPDGARLSASYVPPPGGRGRFDLPRRLSPVLYLAETPEHAVAEVVQPWRGQRIGSPHLKRAGLPLALVRVTLAASDLSLADLCDADVLVGTRIPPDRTASRRREITQPFARGLWEEGYAGLRWWSSFWGDWHTCVLFTERAGGALSWGQPEALEPDHPSLQAAAGLLGIEVEA